MAADQREQIRSLRLRLGVSQSRLCFALGLDRTRYCLWENNAGKLSDESIAKVAEFLSRELSAVQSWRAPGMLANA